MGARFARGGRAFAFFKTNVVPVLVKKGCAGANCHGPQSFNDLKLDPGVSFGAAPYGAIVKGVSYAGPAGSASPAPPAPPAPPLDRFTDDMVMANRLRLLGAAATHPALETIIGKATALASLANVRQSKLLVKDLPLAHGGIFHKGGNNFFLGPQDPDFVTLVEWLELEREELSRSLTTGGEALDRPLGVVGGVVFVRTRRENRRRIFDVDTFLPGARLMFLPVPPGRRLEEAPGPPIDLSARIGLTGTEDIRSPAVSYDARRVLFAMRTSDAGGFNVYEIGLAPDIGYRPGSLRRLTFGPDRAGGDRVHFVDPAYMPDPDDAARTDLSRVAVMFASNLAGAVTRSELPGLLSEADGGSSTTIEDRQRPEAGGSFAGRRVWLVTGAGAGRWARVIRHENRIASGGPAILTLDRALPAPVEDGTVYVVETDGGAGPGCRPAYDIYRMRHAPRGRELETYRDTAARVTFTSDQDLGPAMRSSGEIMFTSLRALQYRSGKPVYNAGMFRALPSGSEFHQHSMNRSGYPLVVDNRELPSGLEVRVVMDPRNLWGGGALMVSDHQFGPDIEPDSPVDTLARPFRPGGVAGRHPSPARPAGATVPGDGGLRVRTSAFRFLRANLPLFPEVGPAAVTFTGVSPGGFFRDPHPMPDGSILVSHDPRPLDHLDPGACPDTDLFLVRPKASWQGEDEVGPGEMIKVRIAAASAPGAADIYPRPVAPRPKEPVLHDLFEQELLGPPGTVRGFPGYPPGTPSFIECYDYYTLDQLLADLSPVARRTIARRSDWQTGTPLDPREQVHFVRVVLAPEAAAGELSAIPAAGAAGGDPASTRSAAGIHGPRAIAAEIPLPADGSFYLELPSGVPFYTQSLDADRMAVRSLDKLFYTVPGEKFRMSVPRALYPMICAGCHGSITGARSDVLRRPDAVTSASRVSATWDEKAHRKRMPRARGGTLPPVTIDFVRDVQPILDTRCATAACHAPPAPAAGLDLTGRPTRHYSVSYESLMRLEDPAGGDASRKAFVAERDAQAIRSYLMEKLMGRELLAPRPLADELPHPRERPLTEAQRLTLIRWIDLGATFRAPVAAPEAALEAAPKAAPEAAPRRPGASGP
jgi:hypothetical protein